MDQMAQMREQLEKACPGLALRVQEGMRRHTSFRIGGPVTLMALPQSAAQAAAALEVARMAGVSPFFLGKGSNLLVADEGFDAFVMKCRLEELRLLSKESIYVGSGVSLAQSAVFAMEQGLAGMEFAHGIPGTLGGAVCMNAGAYEGEMSQIVLYVDCMTEDGRVVRLESGQLSFGYRSSLFSDGKQLILGAALQLKQDAPNRIKGRMLELMERRKAKQPLEFPSAGSTFKRPPGHFAGALIEQCGLKGARVGGAQVSEKHAGFVVNTGGASCNDVLRLMRQVRETVLRECGILLEPEVKLLGCQL